MKNIAPSKMRAAAATSSSEQPLWHAQIGASVPQGQLKSLLATMIAEAKATFRKEDFDGALALFNQALAIASKVDRDIGTRGVLLHNIATCLHHLRDFECAHAHYEQASQRIWPHTGSRQRRNLAV